MIASRNPLNRSDWAGYLTSKNFRDVAKRIREMIGDGQPYTWVATNELFGTRSEVRTDQHVSKFNVYEYSLTVLDTYGVWGIHLGQLPEEVSKPNSCLISPYISFADRQIRIVQFAAAGNRIEWVIAPQEARDEPS